MIDRTVKSPDGKGYQLLPKAVKKKIETAKKLEKFGLLPFSDDEDDELLLETIASHKSKVSTKSQGSQKSKTKPEEAQTNNLMPRTATKAAKEGEMAPFHKYAFEAAGGMDAPVGKASEEEGWTIAGDKQRQSVCQQLTSQKALPTQRDSKIPHHHKLTATLGPEVAATLDLLHSKKTTTVMQQLTSCPLIELEKQTKKVL